MYIEYMLIEREFLENEELDYEPIWCAYELADCRNKIAIGICGKVPDKYADQAMSWGEVEDLLYYPYKLVSLVKHKDVARESKAIHSKGK